MALGCGEQIEIGKLDAIVGQLAKFARAEIKKRYEWMGKSTGELGDRRAVVALILMTATGQPIVKKGGETVVLVNEEALIMPLMLGFVGLAAEFTKFMAQMVDIWNSKYDPSCR
jgi:hypothetical protein